MSGERVATGAGGRVVEVNFQEGDQVRKGDVLLRLDTERLDNEIAKSRRTIEAGREEIARVERLHELTDAQLVAAKAKAEAELARVEEEVRRDRDRRAADVRLAELEIAKAGDEERRTRGLVEQGVLPRVDLDQAVARLREAEEKLRRTRVAVDEVRVDAARCALELVEKDFALKRGELEVRLAAKRGEVDAASKGLANLQLEHGQAVLRAHVDGIVTVGDVKVGDLIEPGKPVVAIAQQKGFRVDAAVSSADVGLLHVGMKARIKLDAYDYQKYGSVEGKVYFITPDSQVNEDKRAMHYVVRIALDSEEVGREGLRVKVKLGMTGTVEILTGEERLLSLAFRKIKDKVATR